MTLATAGHSRLHDICIEIDVGVDTELFHIALLYWPFQHPGHVPVYALHLVSGSCCHEVLSHSLKPDCLAIPLYEVDINERPHVHAHLFSLATDSER
jgi:hypothetical protein